MADKSVGFLVTQGRVALLMSLIGLATLFYQGTSRVLSAEYRIQALEQRADNTDGTLRELTSVVGRLSDTINELNITLREVQVRQEPKK